MENFVVTQTTVNWTNRPEKTYLVLLQSASKYWITELRKYLDPAHYTYCNHLFIYLFGAKKADRFTVVIESMQNYKVQSTKFFICNMKKEKEKFISKQTADRKTRARSSRVARRVLL